jgi:hypothetical protein
MILPVAGAFPLPLSYYAPRQDFKRWLKVSGNAT